MLGPSNRDDGSVSHRTNKKPRARAGLDWERELSAAEQRARNDPVLRDELGRRDLLAVLVLRLEHLDPPSLTGDKEALRADFRDLADLPLHGAEGAHQVLAAVED